MYVYLSTETGHQLVTNDKIVLTVNMLW